MPNLLKMAYQNERSSEEVSDSSKVNGSIISGSCTGIDNLN